MYPECVSPTCCDAGNALVAPQTVGVGLSIRVLQLGQGRHKLSGCGQGKHTLLPDLTQAYFPLGQAASALPPRGRARLGETSKAQGCTVLRRHSICVMQVQGQYDWYIQV